MSPDAIVNSQGVGDRFVVSATGSEPDSKYLPVSIDGKHVADLSISYFVELDSHYQYLKVVESEFWLLSSRGQVPIIRLEYVSGSTKAPSAHWHVHAESGAINRLLVKSYLSNRIRKEKNLSVESLHFPVGGPRFRPCLEDFLELLICDLGIDSIRGWDVVVATGREKWRLRQLKSAVRDQQNIVAEELRRHGWSVEEPDAPVITNRAPYIRY